MSDEKYLTLELEGVVYRLCRSLGWMQQQRFDEAERALLVDGKALDQADGNIAEIPTIEVRLTPSKRNLSRLAARLDLKPAEAMRLPPHHVPALLEAIDALEEATKSAAEALLAGHPTGSASGA